MTAADTPDATQADDGRAVDAVGRLRAAAEMLREGIAAAEDKPPPTHKQMRQIADMGIGAVFVDPAIGYMLADWLEGADDLANAILGDTP